MQNKPNRTTKSLSKRDALGGSRPPSSDSSRPFIEASVLQVRLVRLRTRVARLAWLTFPNGGCCLGVRRRQIDYYERQQKSRADYARHEPWRDRLCRLHRRTPVVLGDDKVTKCCVVCVDLSQSTCNGAGGAGSWWEILQNLS